MAFDDYLAERVRRILTEQKVDFSERKMMGGLVFMVDEKMCVGVDTNRKTNKERLMAQIGKTHYEEALKEKGVKEMDFTGSKMRGFVFI
jgi:hypothetical protein